MRNVSMLYQPQNNQPHFGKNFELTGTRQEVGRALSRLYRNVRRDGGRSDYFQWNWAPVKEGSDTYQGMATTGLEDTKIFDYIAHEFYESDAGRVLLGDDYKRALMALMLEKVTTPWEKMAAKDVRWDTPV